MSEVPLYCRTQVEAGLWGPAWFLTTTVAATVMRGEDFLGSNIRPGQAGIEAFLAALRRATWSDLSNPVSE